MAESRAGVSMELPEEIERAMRVTIEELLFAGRFADEALINYKIEKGAAPLRAAILSRLREAEADRWQPIETAPKDCAVVLVALNGCTTAARHFEDHGWYEINSHWTDAWGGEIWPSHWMPLPDAPALSEAPSQGDQ
ncbi:MAG: hypothetical protein PGN33_14170 [Methylobacterium radiotolerans]